MNCVWILAALFFSQRAASADDLITTLPLSTSCLSRSHIFYTSGTSTYVVSSCPAAVTLPAITTTIFATNITGYESNVSNATFYSATSATSSAAIRSGDFESGNADSFAIPASGDDTTGTVARSGALLPYSGATY